MPDFTSALYLGFLHPRSSIAPWERLTSGVPAALRPSPLGERVARELALLQGCERGTLAASTLHLFWDLFAVLAEAEVSIHVDSKAYPIARWGVERVSARGVPVTHFAHHNVDALARQVRAAEAQGRRSIVVTDGFCPGCGPAPLRAYHDVVRRHSGKLVVDDTQALGVLGEHPSSATPYGRGGGGSLRRAGVRGPELVVAASLAKGFGVPAAVLAGDAAVIQDFEARSQTRVHCSPPPEATMQAAAHALRQNADVGEKRRARLAALVRRFRTRARRAGFATRGGLFPVQTLVPAADAVALHAHLRQLDVHCIVADGDGRVPTISFALTALHDPGDVDLAVAALKHAAAATAPVLGARAAS